MKRLAATLCLLWLVTFACPAGLMAQDSDDIQYRVDDLVFKHYMDGIPYPEAHALGPNALPYLLELLENPELKLFWTNIIVTIGFIEDPSAVDPLIDFLERAEGEVDGASFRALLSVPYALGCIAAGGGDRSIAYLADTIAGSGTAAIQWQFQGKSVKDLVAEYAVMGLAVSGRPEARQLLQTLHRDAVKQSGRDPRRFLTDTVPQALDLMDRMESRGRAAVLNPQ
jgi:hypothetical protein